MTDMLYDFPSLQFFTTIGTRKDITSIYDINKIVWF